MTRTPTLWSALLLLACALIAGPADARRGGGFGGFGGGRTLSRPSSSPFSFRPRVRPPAPPRLSAPPPVITPAPPPSLPSAGGFGSGRARGVAGAPNAPPVPPTVPSAGAFGGGEARGVMGANAKKPISSAPPARSGPSAAAPSPSGPRGTISSAPPQPAPGNVYRDFRRVEPVRGSPNVYVYDRRPSWGFIPFWWYPPIYTPGGSLVSPGGANPLGILLTLAGVAAVIAIAVTLFRRQ